MKSCQNRLDIGTVAYRNLAYRYEKADDCSGAGGFNVGWHHISYMQVNKLQAKCFEQIGKNYHCFFIRVSLDKFPIYRESSISTPYKIIKTY